MKSYKKLTKHDIEFIMIDVNKKVYISDKNYTEMFKQLKLNGIYYPFIVSSFGRIFSLNYRKQKGNLQQLKTQRDRDGYVIIPINYNGIKKQYRLHRLIALTFIKNKKNKPEINHIDGNKENNTIYNLEWCTTEENIRHAHDTGLADSRGINNYNCNHTNEEIHKVCKLIENNYGNLKEISKKSGVDYHTVATVYSLRGWRHISKEYDFSNYSYGINAELVCKLAISKKYTIKEISKITKLSNDTVRDILRGKTHKNISSKYNIK